MKAFRYFGSHWIDTLRDKRFKLAKPSELNDPFDCVGAYTGNFPRTAAKQQARQLTCKPEVQSRYAHLPRDQRKKAILQLEKELARKYQTGYSRASNLVSERKTSLDAVTRLLCMSSTEQQQNVPLPVELTEVLMWSHYADEHSGIRIGLNLTKIKGDRFKIAFVTYSAERPLHDWSKSQNLGSTDFLLKSVYTKNPAWSYENEIRLMTSPKYCVDAKLDDGTLASFFNFTPDIIWRVDFGLHMDIDAQAECQTLLSKDYPHVEVYKAKYHPTQYSLIYERLN